jgi:hypothetical protein
MPSPPSILVSGAAELIAPAAEALRSRGATVTEVHDLADLPVVCSEAGPGAFDSYIQLPANFQPRGETAIARVHHFYADGVLARFRALDAALASLADPARLTYVLGRLPPEAATEHDREARQALTRVLTHAARADRQGGRLHVRVLAAGTAPEDVALVALGRGPDPGLLEERLSGASYADWRVELFGLAVVET